MLLMAAAEKHGTKNRLLSSTSRNSCACFPYFRNEKTDSQSKTFPVIVSVLMQG